LKKQKRLIKKLIHFINLSEIQRESMGKNGRKKVIKEFEKSIVIKEYIKIIESVTC
jgi:galacturonosyltransferase